MGDVLSGFVAGLVASTRGGCVVVAVLAVVFAVILVRSGWRG